MALQAWCNGYDVIAANSEEEALAIAAWCATQPQPPEAIAILDDDADMVHLTPWLVRTDFNEGLLDEHVEAACALLGRVFP